MRMVITLRVQSTVAIMCRRRPLCLSMALRCLCTRQRCAGLYRKLVTAPRPNTAYMPIASMNSGRAFRSRFRYGSRKFTNECGKAEICKKIVTQDLTLVLTPTCFREKRGWIAEEADHEEGLQSKFFGGSTSPSRNPVRTDPNNDIQSVGIPVFTGTPIQQDGEIEEEYKKLKIESQDQQVIITKLQRDNEEYVQKLKELSRKCMNYESLIEKYKVIIESTKSEHDQAKKEMDCKESKTIQELTKTIETLKVANSELTNKNKELLCKNDKKDPPGDSYYEIVIYGINQLEEITRSYLTKKLMNHPVLTPSLTIVDKQDVFNILDYSPEHPYNRVQEFQKAKIFPPMKSVVDLRYELKRMVEEQESNDGDVQTSSSNILSDNSEQLLEKISQLESRLDTRNNKIKKCNLRKKELEDRLDSCGMTISMLQNELIFTRKNCYKLAEDVSKSYTEADVADYKRQITQLHESISQYKKENTNCIEQDVGLQKNLAKFRATNSEIPHKNQEIADLKKAQEEKCKRISEMEQKIRSLETLKQKIQEEKQEIEKDLSVRIQVLEQDLIRKNEIVVSQKKRIFDLTDSERLKQQNEELKQRHNQLCDSIETLLYCKASNEPMKIPCFTPSGNTVNMSVIEKWISNGTKDPWNGKPCNEAIKNLLAINLDLLLVQHKSTPLC
ncbi:unnamed protein product [Moneuplotes crassus]|uniref:U-box domain-containing protein n=1 Tax=Euplotes crassus TaxID=5936 RepID=A0AAD1Y8I8_EUPCR|nr:unnamed protein product [Moneuplotes crassus]